ncbi:MAG: DNA polymerase III subunit chi [Gammaproteobacteria bacterium HGW-Gammaproteobacteria-14]|nr:MAG: DNA polymerase III subunit chi [Gammaproteobacteria bacterium HGW-Gammaproteobacteria-14]
MTEVWFYISEDSRPDARARLLQRLIERALPANRQLYLQSSDSDQARKVDDWLWQESGFIPHGLAGEEYSQLQPVVIGSGDSAGEHSDILVNLDQRIPPHIDQFKRIIELVAGPEDQRQSARDRWKSYRDRGYPVTKHELPREPV